MEGRISFVQAKKAKGKHKSMIVDSYIVQSSLPLPRSVLAMRTNMLGKRSFTNNTNAQYTLVWAL